jgi:hypothetical protein
MKDNDTKWLIGITVAIFIALSSGMLVNALKKLISST